MAAPEERPEDPGGESAGGEPVPSLERRVEILEGQIVTLDQKHKELLILFDRVLGSLSADPGP